MNRLDAQLAENRVTGENNLRQRLEEKARRKKELMRKREELAAEENQLRADLQKNLKDADTLNREAERDFEKERRKARETAVGPDAVALRKEIEQQIQDNPLKNNSSLSSPSNGAHGAAAGCREDALRRADERRTAYRKKAAEKAKAADELQTQTERVHGEIVQVDEQLDLLERMNEPAGARKLRCRRRTSQLVKKQFASNFCSNSETWTRNSTPKSMTCSGLHRL